jgi:1-acyl-sn-glycerol-3-phosphate acyltransferase
MSEAPQPGDEAPTSPPERVRTAIERARKRLQEYRQFPRWPRRRPVRWARFLLVSFGVVPVMRAMYSHEFRGRLYFGEVEEPCLVISNHNMRLDPAILVWSMPRGFRQRLAIAASAEDMFESRWKAFWIELLGNAFPFTTVGGGIRESLDKTMYMLDEGWNVLLFPEGKLTVMGPMQPFKGGIGLLARESGVPVLPMRIDVLRPGLREGKRFPRPRGRVRVTVGPPIRVSRDLSSDEATALLEQSVRNA